MSVHEKSDHTKQLRRYPHQRMYNGDSQRNKANNRHKQNSTPPQPIRKPNSGPTRRQEGPSGSSAVVSRADHPNKNSERIISNDSCINKPSFCTGGDLQSVTHQPLNDNQSDDNHPNQQQPQEEHGPIEDNTVDLNEEKESSPSSAESNTPEEPPVNLAISTTLKISVRPNVVLYTPSHHAISRLNAPLRASLDGTPPYQNRRSKYFATIPSPPPSHWTRSLFISDPTLVEHDGRFNVPSSWFDHLFKYITDNANRGSVIVPTTFNHDGPFLASLLTFVKVHLDSMAQLTQSMDDLVKKERSFYNLPPLKAAQSNFAPLEWRETFEDGYSPTALYIVSNAQIAERLIQCIRQVLPAVSPFAIHEFLDDDVPIRTSQDNKPHYPFDIRSQFIHHMNDSAAYNAIDYLTQSSGSRTSDRPALLSIRSMLRRFCTQSFLVVTPSSLQYLLSKKLVHFTTTTHVTLMIDSLYDQLITLPKEKPVTRSAPALLMHPVHEPNATTSHCDRQNYFLCGLFYNGIIPQSNRKFLSLFYQPTQLTCSRIVADLNRIVLLYGFNPYFHPAHVLLYRSLFTPNQRTALIASRDERLKDQHDPSIVQSLNDTPESIYEKIYAFVHRNIYQCLRYMQGGNYAPHLFEQDLMYIHSPAHSITAVPTLTYDEVYRTAFVDTAQKVRMNQFYAIPSFKYPPVTYQYQDPQYQRKYNNKKNTNYYRYNNNNNNKKKNNNNHRHNNNNNHYHHPYHQKVQTPKSTSPPPPPPYQYQYHHAEIIPINNRFRQHRQGGSGGGRRSQYRQTNPIF